MTNSKNNDNFWDLLDEGYKTVEAVLNNQVPETITTITEEHGRAFTTTEIVYNNKLPTQTFTPNNNEEWDRLDEAYKVWSKAVDNNLVPIGSITNITEENNQPQDLPYKVGTCIILRCGTYVLMGLRKGSLDAGTWSFPGGHVDGSESPADAVLRELKEETGIDIQETLKPLGFSLTEFSPEKKYITLFFGLEVPEQYEAQIMEPNKCDGWRWVQEDNLPEPLSTPILDLLSQQRDVLPL